MKSQGRESGGRPGMFNFTLSSGTCPDGELLLEGRAPTQCCIGQRSNASCDRRSTLPLFPELPPVSCFSRLFGEDRGTAFLQHLHVCRRIPKRRKTCESAFPFW